MALASLLSFFLSYVSTSAKQKTSHLGFFNWMIFMLGECAVKAQLSLYQYQKVA